LPPFPAAVTRFKPMADKRGLYVPNPAGAARLAPHNVLKFAAKA